MRYKNVNGVRIEFTPEEEAARGAEELAEAVVATARQNANAAAKSRAAATEAKLAALGLSIEDIREALDLRTRGL